MKKNTKRVLSVGALLCLVIIFMAVYFVTRPKTNEGEKRISVAVIHGDGSEKVFAYQTDAEYLGEVLEEDGLIQGEEGPFGMYIKVVDGERAVYEEDDAYWAFYYGDEYAAQSVDLTPILDGDTFKLVYTYG